MRRAMWVVMLMGMVLLVPRRAEAEDRAAFRGAVELKGFRLLAIQHRDQVKIMDSWARQSLTTICHRSSIGGEDPLYTALDIAFRPEAWAERNIIYVQAIPIRQRLAAFETGSEAGRILREGLVSPRFIEREEVLRLLSQLSGDMKLLASVNKIKAGYETYRNLWATLAFVPPGEGGKGGPWRLAMELWANFPEGQAELARRGEKAESAVPGYSAEEAKALWLAYQALARGWAAGDARMVNGAIGTLTTMLPRIDPEGGYPSVAKRMTELWYNRTFYGTVMNVFLYFVAMTLFLLVTVVGNRKPIPAKAGAIRGHQRFRLWRYAYPMFSVAVILHLASMGVRMWLAGRWPTQNQFESVLGAALLGCIVGWCLETWKKNGLFGMAFSFVGFLAMTACMAAPYMFGNDLGGAISKTAGILQTYWLYIHVNVIIASYALIAASFVLGGLYLLLKLWYWIHPREPYQSRSRVDGDNSDFPAANGGQAHRLNAEMLGALDQANMVILQMAFWFLGIGIVCGAVWADYSWGRPWGWDPKETFALVTWIVYLIIVHVRLVVPKLKAETTAWMSIAGFAVMMFNWIGVNYFLAGLHSYA